MAASRERDGSGGDPPESTRLRLGDDIAWSEINGVYDRDDSLKENTNPKCVLKNSHPGGGGSSSQRFSGNLKPTAAPIIGLSGKLGGSARRHQHRQQAMFPRKAAARTGGGGRAAPKAAGAVPEPGSPKVSCIGKVLSDRERARLGRPPRAGAGARAPGCCGGIGFLMMRRSRSRSRSRHNAVECVDQSPPLPDVARRSEAAAEEEEATVAEPEPALPLPLAPGLRGLRRLASGRRAPEWAAAQVEDDGRVARSGPL